MTTQKQIEQQVLEVIENVTGRALTLDCNIHSLNLKSDTRREIFVRLQKMLTVSSFTTQQMNGLDTPRGIASRIHIKRSQAIGMAA